MLLLRLALESQDVDCAVWDEADNSSVVVSDAAVVGLLLLS